MISKTTLKRYGYKNINDYFNYIIDSYINGNFSQVKELYKKCNEEQKEEFNNFLYSSIIEDKTKLNIFKLLLK